MSNSVKERVTKFSPFSNPRGEYPTFPLNRLLPEEATSLQRLLPHLRPEERISLKIDSEIIAEGVHWAALQVKRLVRKHGQQNVILIYALKGGEWFRNDVEYDLATKCDFSLGKRNIPIIGVKINHSAADRTFDEQVTLENDLPQALHDVTGKVVISLDDIGRSGLSQEFLEQILRGRGAKEFYSINLFEKVSPAGEEDPVKQASPDFAVFQVPHAFYLGLGLDSHPVDEDGNINHERELAERNLHFLAKLIIDEVARK